MKVEVLIIILRIDGKDKKFVILDFIFGKLFCSVVVIVEDFEFNDIDRLFIEK